MSLPVALAALFLIGILHDVLWTLYIRAVSERRRVKASLVSGVLPAFGMTDWTLMVKTEAEGTIPGIACYCVGGALGTFLCFRPQPPADA